MLIPNLCKQAFGEHFDLKQLRGLKLGLAFVLALGVGLLTAVPASAADCPDNDGDGYVVCGGGCVLPVGKQCGDCNDDNAAINPGATERCDDAIDSDCDSNNNNGYPNLGQDCALCNGPDCSGTFCTNADCNSFTGDLCLTGSLASQGNGVVCGLDGLSETCAPPDEAPIAIWANEGLGEGNPGNISELTCFDGQDNDCDDSGDLDDNGCWAPEICDGLDNDGDGSIDETFPLSDPGQVGNICDVGIGECQRSSTYACNEAGTDAVCGATAGAPKNEGSQFGNSCADGKDNDCDGATDLVDSDCAGFGDPELCGDGIDNDGDGFTDEGFPQIGQACQTAEGACRDIGQLVCNSELGGSGDGVACNATALDPPEPGTELTCDDFIDNDCDGFTDADDTDCGAALADLGVTCSLPYIVARPGFDCTGKHDIKFGAATDGVTLKADLLALNNDGTLLGIIEGVNSGDTAHLASRLDPMDWHLDTKTNNKGTRHTVFYPMPLLRVTGTKGGLEDVAYCGILPYHEVTDPDGLTISLSETNTLEVSGFLPLVDVDSLSISLDGIDILANIAGGIDPVTAFPTNGSPLCTTPGECVLQIAAGCGDGSLVDVEISNLIVEGLDTGIVSDAKEGVEEPEQVNTYHFDVSGLPPGGHIFYIAGMPLPLPPVLSEQCLLDDLADTGTASAFGIQIYSPFDQQVVVSAPVNVVGTACGGNEIVDLKIQGNNLDVTVPTSQVCITGDGITAADECYVDFAEPIDETDLDDAAEGIATGGTFHAGSNRIIADATDDEGNRTFNTDVIFGLGEVQAPGLTVTAEEESFRVAGQLVGEAVAKEIIDMQNFLGEEIDPAFIVGLEESAVQDFFNEKCEDALDQFAAQAEANLNNKEFATVSFTPSCSCNLNNVPIVLESVTFTPSSANPTCAVDFRTDEIGVTIHLPDIRVQVGAHKSCTTKGLFGECLARTKINITAVSQILNPAFEFVITETAIETKTAPSEDTQVFTWIIADGDGSPLFNPGACSGGTQNGESCITDGQCPGAGTCLGVTKNGDPPYNPVTQNDSGIECWGAAVCNVFAGIGAVLIEIFTLGFADGFEIVGIIDFDFEFKEDFLAEFDGAEPDPLELDAIEIDEEQVASFEQGKFTAGDIDVEIEAGGLKIEFPAAFESQNIDPMSEETPGAVVTPAVGPTISNLVAASDEISIGMADDVFNQLFASMKDAGTLEAFCTDGDGLTVDTLLPPLVDGGCDSLGAADGEITVGDATIQGICHAIRGATCNTLTAGTQGLTNAKVGACTGFSGGDCTTLNLGPKLVCNAIPARDISFDDSVLFCARQDMEPRLLFRNSDASNNRVDTDLLLNDLNVVLAIDKANDGYTGELEALQGCFGEEGDSAPDCLLYATCLDLTLKTEMGIDNSSCAPNQTGFIFGLKENGVIPSGVQAGVMCSAATTAADNEVIAETAESTTINTVAESAEAFTPPFCADGLTLGGILDFTSPDAKIFTITTDEATMGFADFLFLTGSLGPPDP